ncbi:MAG: coiled-coil protein [Candidatus Heimdallarchaeota archaeon]
MSDQQIESIELVEKKLLEISNIEARARDIKQQREEFNRKVTTIANKRNLLNEQVKELIKTAKEEREKRDHCNETISEIKSKKELLLKELNGFDEQAKRLDQQLNERQERETKGNLRRSPVVSAKKIRREIRQLEWKLTTTPNLPIMEERELVERITRLEEKIQDVQEGDVIARDLQTILGRINALKGKLRALDHQLKNQARESRFHHKTMIQAFKNADILRKQADELHAQFLNTKDQANAIHNEYLGYIREINRIRQDLNKTKQKTRARREKIEREKIEEKVEDAKRKFEEGRKLSFEEFRTLISKGMI